MLNEIPSLREVQRWLKWAVTDPRGVEEALKESCTKDISFRFAPLDAEKCGARYSEPQPRCLEQIVAQRHLREQRLSVYAEGYFIRLTNALAVDFETVQEILGPDLFPKLIADYLKEFPSCSPNIEEAGRHMAHFIKRHEVLGGFPFLSDLAALEWLTLESFYADDAPTLDAGEIQRIKLEQWPQVTFAFDSSVRVLTTCWPVDILWEAKKSGSKELKSNISESREERHLLIWRQDFEVKVNSVDLVEADLLDEARDGSTLGDLCETFQNRSTDIPEIFSRWIKLGLVRKVALKI